MIKEVKNIHNYDLKEYYNDCNSFSILKYKTRTNASIVEIKNGSVYIRTYEKGVENETGACGTACCAAYYMYKYSNYIPLSKKPLGLYLDEDNNLWLSSYVKKN